MAHLGVAYDMVSRYVEVVGSWDGVVLHVRASLATAADGIESLASFVAPHKIQSYAVDDGRSFEQSSSTCHNYHTGFL